VREIRIYVEGGGGKDSRASLRRGFGRFFAKVAAKSRITTVACGNRDDAFQVFLTASGNHPDALNLLLVDSEAAVSIPAKDFLARREKSWELQDIPAGEIHLMVQVMESWFLADREGLEAYYGKSYRLKALPPNPAVESIPKADVLSGLKAAPKHTSKGEYHKIKHASELLARLDHMKVRKAAPHCEFLFQRLAEE
jgi:hypothetical protein